MTQDILKPCHAMPPVLGVGVLIIEMQLKPRPRPKGDDHVRTLLHEIPEIIV